MFLRRRRPSFSVPEFERLARRLPVPGVALTIHPQTAVPVLLARLPRGQKVDGLRVQVGPVFRYSYEAEGTAVHVPVTFEPGTQRQQVLDIWLNTGDQAHRTQITLLSVLPTIMMVFYGPERKPALLGWSDTEWDDEHRAGLTALLERTRATPTLWPAALHRAQAEVQAARAATA